MTTSPWPNFNLVELRCKCGHCGSDGREMDTAFMERLQQLRTRLRQADQAEQRLPLPQAPGGGQERPHRASTAPARPWTSPSVVPRPWSCCAWPWIWASPASASRRRAPRGFIHLGTSAGGRFPLPLSSGATDHEALRPARPAPRRRRRRAVQPRRLQYRLRGGHHGRAPGGQLLLGRRRLPAWACVLPSPPPRRRTRSVWSALPMPFKAALELRSLPELDAWETTMPLPYMTQGRPPGGGADGLPHGPGPACRAWPGASSRATTPRPAARPWCTTTSTPARPTASPRKRRTGSSSKPSSRRA